MKRINKILDAIRSAVRGYMNSLAKLLNRLSGGRLSPDAITITSLLMHIPIAWLIAMQHNYWAAGLLIVFGLFDALDGALARLQGSANAAGMLLDASTDRMKEVLLYTGAAYALVAGGTPYAAAWAVAACGASLSVSYVKAKGETAVAGGPLSPNDVNRLFQDGLFRFEVRMALLAIGLLSNQLLPAIIVIAVMSTYTAFERLIKISRKL